MSNPGIDRSARLLLRLIGESQISGRQDVDGGASFSSRGQSVRIPPPPPTVVRTSSIINE